MPSFRQKVTTYLRQLSFASERDSRNRIEQQPSSRSFITQYLEGVWEPPDSIPVVYNGKSPEELPEITIARYVVAHSISDAAYTGPLEGLTGVKRAKSHLTAGVADDIDYIDVLNETVVDRASRDSATLKTPLEQCDRVPKSDSVIATDNNYVAHIEKINEPQRKKSLSSMVSKSKTPIKEENSAKGSGIHTCSDNEPIACIADWNRATEEAYGLSISLYEKNLHTLGNVGDPIADCFGIATREDSCIMAMADGVNWGEGARVAARSAIQGSMEYLNSAIFGLHRASTTKEVFVSLIRSFWEAHNYILQVGGALSTLTVAIVLPVKDSNNSVVCCCNVGDSLGYIFSRKNIVREITQASHNVNLIRDMRDALGALGPVYGDKPEMANLTLSMTVVEEGDIVFLTSDGISDNFDPVVGRFAEAAINYGGNSSVVYDNNASIKQQLSPRQADRKKNVPLLAPKRQNKSAPTLTVLEDHPDRKARSSIQGERVNEKKIAQKDKEKTMESKYVSRSKTFIESARTCRQSLNASNRSGLVLPKVTAAQRHKLTLLRMADLLVYGINGSLRPCSTAKQLCQLLIDFVSCITAAKRTLLEQRELYYKVVTGADGSRKEIRNTVLEHKVIRKRLVDGTTFSLLPGKLDHASIVAYKVKNRSSESHIT
ncbi:PP2C-like domain-containing protein CG9801 [Anopheles albimanus]|uniref:PPM-type phosphatase domain-containing protein n=1 Tax=Anopheles albimanus TaxID=7167 RepID=A0A8W7JXB0_ANOAL|nr:PP2C-like domain-containing protein CG9801 [Anopheles albimanus]